MENRTALITGGTGRLGGELVKIYLKEGYKLILIDKNEEKLKEIQNENIKIIVCDLADCNNLYSIAQQLEKEKIDIFINCVVDMNVCTNINEMYYQLNTNFVFPILLSKVISHLNNRVKTIFINSNAGINTSSGADLYCAAKYGLRGFAEAMKQCGHDVISFYPNHISDYKKLAELIYQEAHYNEKIDSIY